MKKFIPIIAIVVVIILVVVYLKTRNPKKPTNKSEDVKKGAPEKPVLEKLADAVNPIKSIGEGLGILKPSTPATKPAVAVPDFIKPHPVKPVVAQIKGGIAQSNGALNVPIKPVKPTFGIKPIKPTFGTIPRNKLHGRPFVTPLIKKVYF